MKELHADDFVFPKNRLVHASFPLIPILRKMQGIGFGDYNKLYIGWLWFRIYCDDYGWGFNKAFKAWFSFDTPYLRFCIN